MQLLITRALDEAERTAAKIEALGHTPLLSPVLEMQATAKEWPVGCFNAVIATSAQAFELLFDTPEWPLPEARRLMPLFLVGQRTLEAAQRKGFLGPATLAYDAKELGQSFVERARPGQNLLYLAGRERKNDLEDQLKAAGYALNLCEIYQAEAALALSEDAIVALQDNAIDAVLHYSRRSGEIFLQLAQAHGIAPQLIQHICISEDAAMPFLDVECAGVLVAPTPNEQGMLETVETLANAPIDHVG